MKAQKARDIIERFPNLSKRELSKLLYKENPILFKDYEAARFAIRAVTGAVGDRKWKYEQSDKYKGPLSIPKGDLNDFSPYKVDGKIISVLSDIHIPYHHLDALNIAVDETIKQNADVIILNGDILDCYQISRFDREPNKATLKQEIDILCHFINDLKRLLPKAKIVYKFGNHEERMSKFLLQKAPELYGFEVFDLDSLIKIQFLALFNKPLDIDFVKGKRIIHVNKLNIVHGHEWPMGITSPVNPARGYALRAKASVLAGHRHQVSEHQSKDINGVINSSWSQGCLCDLNPSYSVLNDWSHGFCVVYNHKDDGFEVKNYKIIDGKIV